MTTTYAKDVAAPKFLDWRKRLAFINETMREISRQTDPQVISKTYSSRMRQLLPLDGFISLSRRDLAPPAFRITRSSRWTEEINPWKQRDRLPLVRGGLLGELIYGDEPRLIDDLIVSADDPAFEYLEGMRSLVAIPHYDQGIALNMVVLLRREPNGFDPEELPEMVQTNNLYGRATHNLVLAEKVKEAYERSEEHTSELQSLRHLVC